MLFRLLREAFSASFLRQRSKIEKPEEYLAVARKALDQGATERALSAYAEIHSRWPKQAEACHQLGRLKGMLGELEEALALLETAVQSMPEAADAWADLGTVYLLLELYPQAGISLEHAIRLGKADLAVWYNLALTYEKQGKSAEAIRWYRYVLDVEPPFQNALRGWFMLHLKLGHQDEARQALQTILAVSPNCAEAHAALGYLLLKHDFQPDAALEQFDTAMAGGLEQAELLDNRGIALQDLGRIDEALTSFTMALEFEPENPVFRFHRGLAHLIKHDFAQGWPDYEMRLLSEDWPQGSFPWPRWDGSCLTGKTILIYAEQGLGDQLMFSSCLPELIAWAGHCVIECHERLAPIFRRSFPAATVYGVNQRNPTDWWHELPIIDVCLPIGSLPLHFRRRLEDFPSHQGFLRADPNRVGYWRDQLKALGPGIKVGLSWRGGTLQSRQRYRSLPLCSLAPLFKLTGVTFVNLQYGDCEPEITSFQDQQLGFLQQFPEAIADYDDTAALVSALDLVISVCTSIQHLGGALGRPVWVMAPAGPEWRYGIDGETMPWYPSVRIYRQAKLFVWDNVVIAIENALRHLIDEPMSSREQR